MFNKCILVGRLTKNPETSTSPSGTVVTRFTLAVDRKFQKQGEEKQADFINIITFNKTAEFVSKWFTKGQMAIVCGSIQTRSWDGQDGQKKYSTDIIAEEVNFCGAKTEGQTPAPKKEDDFIELGEDDSLPF